MRIKSRLIGQKMNIENRLLSLEDLQLTTTLYVDSYPTTRDIGIFSVLEDITEEENEFQVIIKNLNNKELGRGSRFRTSYLTKDGEGILIYNLNRIEFKNPNSGYIVEVLNGENLFDRYEIKSSTDIYKIYTPALSAGVIKLFEDDIE